MRASARTARAEIPGRGLGSRTDTCFPASWESPFPLLAPVKQAKTPITPAKEIN